MHLPPVLLSDRQVLAYSRGNSDVFAAYGKHGTCTQTIDTFATIMESGYGDSSRYPRSYTDDPGIPITAVVNENWRGKNDPTERRRIQNRLNQRAFRQRQRAGESPKQYRPRSMSGSTPSPQKEDSDDETEISTSGTESSALSSRSGVPPHSEAPAISAPATNSPNGMTDAQSGKVWDELAHIINRNLMAAAVANAQHLGIDLTALQQGTIMYSPRPTSRSIPAALMPVELQHRVPHDPIIDIIPHPRLRHNVLQAVATRQVDAAALYRCIRGSGALEHSNGTWQRGGLVVWSSPEQVASWELSEPFVRLWVQLLHGCEDLIAATNAWRSRRGERLFPVSL